MEDKELALFRAAIAGKGLLKKSLARRCGVSRPYFSEYLHGDRPMPDHVRDRLIRELGLEGVFERLDAEGAEGCRNI
jgi:transcriptional regulator with XRE-family HTH domain